MITKFSIAHFKSLNDFQLTLGKFVCLVGLNGAGKSSVLQAFDFVGQLAEGKIQDWLDRREWVANDLLSRFDKSKSISFSIDFLFPETGSVTWKGDFNIRSLSCSSESITVDGVLVLDTPRSKLRVRRKDGEEESIPWVIWSSRGLLFRC